MLCLWNNETELISDVVTWLRTVFGRVSGVVCGQIIWTIAVEKPTYNQECFQTIHDALEQLDRVWHIFMKELILFDYLLYLFIYLGFYIAFNTVQVILQQVVRRQRKSVHTVGQGSVL